VKHPQENPKLKNIFPVDTRCLAESIDVLHTSLALATGELWNYKVWSNKWPLWAQKGFIPDFQTL